MNVPSSELNKVWKTSTQSSCYLPVNKCKCHHYNQSKGNHLLVVNPRTMRVNLHVFLHVFLYGMKLITRLSRTEHSQINLGPGANIICWDSINTSMRCVCTLLPPIKYSAHSRLHMATLLDQLLKQVFCVLVYVNFIIFVSDFLFLNIYHVKRNFH